MKKIFILFIFAAFIACSTLPFPDMVEVEDTLTAEEHNDLGVVYEEKKDHDLAEKEYKKAIKINKTWAVPYFNLGNIYYKKVQYDLCEVYYRKALALNDHYADCWNNLAYLLYAQGKYKQALEYVNKALAMERKQEYFDTQRSILEKMK